MAPSDGLPYDVFITAPVEAGAWAERLERDLAARGLVCAGTTAIRLGERFATTLDEELRRSRALVVVWLGGAAAGQVLDELRAFAETTTPGAVPADPIPLFLGEASIPQAPEALREFPGVIVPDEALLGGPDGRDPRWDRAVDALARSIKAADQLELDSLFLPAQGAEPTWSDLSPPTRAVFAWARASERNDVGTRALLHGLLRVEGSQGHVYRALSEAGASTVELHAVLEQVSPKGQFAMAEAPANALKGFPHLSPEAHEAVHKAWNLAREHGLSQVTNDTLLLALLVQEDSAAMDGLSEVLGGAGVFGLIDAVASGLSSQAPAVPGPGRSSGDEEGNQPDRPPSTAVSTDMWTLEDDLDHEIFADAVATFILDPRSRAPLTIGIKARWGAGKTSVMRKIRHKLDPPPRSPAATSGPAGRDPHRLTVKELLSRTRNRSPDQAAEALEPRHLVGSRRVTIWFNAWKYQSREQLWAGLAHAILDQVEARLSPRESDLLWASLQIRRLRLPDLRRRVYTYLLWRVAPWAAVGLVAALSAGVALVLFPPALYGLLPALLLSMAQVVRRAVKALSDEVQRAIPKLVDQPDYDSKIGYLHLVDDDLHRILDVAGATPARPFVVFIDDLDRCSYETVAEVIEALNVFLAGDYNNCVFVIAMEPDLIAAHIRVAYASLFEHLEDDAGDLGWRFLEKMVQLPLSLPDPDADQVAQLVDGVLSREPEGKPITTYADNSPEVTAARGQLRRHGGATSLDALVDAVRELRIAPDGGRDAAPAVNEGALQRAVRLESAGLFKDSQAQAMVKRYARDLSGNPRELKRFVNVFRFFAYLDFGRRLAGQPSPGIEGAAKLARIAISWPSLARALVASHGTDTNPLIVQLEHAARSGDWDTTISSLSSHLEAKIASTPGLRAVLAQDPEVGTTATKFL